MWPFSKKNKKGDDGGLKQSDVDVSHLSDAKQKLFEQMREKRAEIGEEEIAKMNAALRHEQLKNQIKNDIDNDPQKRERLLDEIRSSLRDPGKL